MVEQYNGQSSLGEEDLLPELKAGEGGSYAIISASLSMHEKPAGSIPLVY